MLDYLIAGLERVGVTVHTMSLDGWVGLSKNPDWLCGVAGPIFTSDRAQIALCPDVVDGLTLAIADALIYLAEAFTMNGYDIELAYDQLADDMPAKFSTLTTWQADCAVERLEEINAAP